MSDQNKVVGFKKGFREKKKPTKGQVQKENQALAQQLQAQLNYLMQQTMNGMQKTMQLDKEVDQMAKLLFYKKTENVDKGALVMIGYIGQLFNEDGSLADPTNEMYAPYALINVGDGSFVPGFEDQLMGSKVGDIKDIEITFPKEYPEKLAEKKAKFKVQVHAAWTPAVNEVESLFTEFKKKEAEKLQKEKEATSTKEDSQE